MVKNFLLRRFRLRGGQDVTPLSDAQHFVNYKRRESNNIEKKDGKDPEDTRSNEFRLFLIQHIVSLF